MGLNQARSRDEEDTQVELLALSQRAQESRGNRVRQDFFHHYMNVELDRLEDQRRTRGGR